MIHRQARVAVLSRANEHLGRSWSRLDVTGLCCRVQYLEIFTFHIIEYIVKLGYIAILKPDASNYHI